MLIPFYSAQSIWGAPGVALESSPQSLEALLRSGSMGPPQMQEMGPSEQRGRGLARKVWGPLSPVLTWCLQHRSHWSLSSFELR